MARNHSEFVATEPGQDVCRLERRSSSLRRLLQQQIANAMTKRVVNDLETI